MADDKPLPTSITPGPWRVFRLGAEPFEIVTDRKTAYETQSIADVRGKSNANANATLIAASPEMLDALKLAQRALNTAPRFRVGDTDSYAIAASVDKAIAQAGQHATPAAPCPEDRGVKYEDPVERQLDHAAARPQASDPAQRAQFQTKDDPREIGR